MMFLARIKAPQPILINVTHETVSSQVDEAPVGSHVREGDNVLTPYGAALTSPK
ncbi:hypothetical protein M404DRAFT_994912 [Pisolithus tinctorius Marx 270]|uniref:Uncharacterized protein n=1 Tax=Pisolithus tinctorius Marx 270 TaxID=870435 RepID=A0A0C3PQG3_PISTI|nr:hypothetical protein M404DRAFT_994912 [Pisolithus tinctorius Marx 270]